MDASYVVTNIHFGQVPPKIQWKKLKKKTKKTYRSETFKAGLNLKFWKKFEVLFFTELES